MPYVERASDGKIKRLFAIKQASLAEEWLPYDHADIAEYNLQHPPPGIGITGVTIEDVEKGRVDIASCQHEIEQLNNAIIAHMRMWTSLETILSCFFHAVLNSKPGSSDISYAIYYSLNGFDARQRMVDKAFVQFVDENPKCNDLLKHWAQIFTLLTKCAKTRNRVAHGAPLVFVDGAKKEVRLSPPPFDVNKVGRLIKKGSDPGLTAAQILSAINLIDDLAIYLDAISTAILEFHRKGPDTLPKTLPRLEECLQNFRPLQIDDQNQ